MANSDGMMASGKYDQLVFDVIGDGVWRDLSDPPAIRDGARELEITGVSCTTVQGNFPWNVIVVHTDEDVYGVGEAFPGPVAEHVDFLETGIFGHNPLDVDRLVEHMVQLLSGLGGSVGYSQAALSGIEIALWDIAGKVTGLPAYQLLGGKYRDAVQIYADCHAGEALSDAPEKDPYEIYDPAAYAATARDALDSGFSAIKFDLDVRTESGDTAHRRLSNDAIEHKVDIVEAIRDTVGSSPAVAFDLHWNFSVETALNLARKIEPYDVAWLEDPVAPDGPESHRRVTQGTDTPILTGENLTRVEGVLPYLTEGATDLLAPDIQKCGGMLEFRKIATVADAYDVPIAPHNISSPVGTLASVHAAATVPNAFVLEWHARELEWWDELHQGPPLIQDGQIPVPESPGIGIDLDLDVLEEHLAPGETCPTL